MMNLEVLVQEFIRLTAGRCDFTAHSKLARAVGNGNLTVAWPRVRNVADSIESAERYGYSTQEQHRLGQLLGEIEAEWNRQK